MAEKRFEVDLPDAVLTGFGWQEDEVHSRLRETLVMELLRLDQLSEVDAAALLSLDRGDLLEVMARYRVPAVRMSLEELKPSDSNDLYIFAPLSYHLAVTKPLS